MSAPVDPAQMNGQPPPVAPLVPVTREEVAQELLRAVKAMAMKATTDEIGAEAKDWGLAAKALADAYVVLDPTLDAVGVPLEHQVAMQALDHAHKEHVENVRAQQAAPAQTRRKIKVNRAADGGVDSYDMEG